MDFVWVFPLILLCLSNGQCRENRLCSLNCPSGYYKVGNCEDQQLSCERCKINTYTKRNNSATRCERCNPCGYSEKQIKPCSFTKDTVCDCKDGYYNANPVRGIRDCQECLCPCKRDGDNDKCEQCQRCLKNPVCKMKCEASTMSPSTDPPTPPSVATLLCMTTADTADMTTRASKITSNPVMNPVSRISVNWTRTSWLFILPVVVILLGPFLLLLPFIRKYLGSCTCWILSKDLEPAIEDPILNEQKNNEGEGSTTLILNISEETPLMNLGQSPAIPEHSAHSISLLPEAKIRADNQDEQSKRWLAIILYAIIKEVPLRRWKEFLRLLSVADQQLELVELESGLGVGYMERQYQMLRVWSQQSSASLNDVFSALHYMDLSGCAQQLQESLEKLQCLPEGFKDGEIMGRCRKLEDACGDTSTKLLCNEGRQCIGLRCECIRLYRERN